MTTLDKNTSLNTLKETAWVPRVAKVVRRFYPRAGDPELLKSQLW